MKRSLTLYALVSTALSMMASAIPQSFGGGNGFGPVIPSTPRFNGDLTANFLSAEQWAKQSLGGPWGQGREYAAGRETLRMTANPTLFGSVPDSVQMVREEGKLREVLIRYVDAGTYFGFDYDGETSRQEKLDGDARRVAFRNHYDRLATDLRQRLVAGCGSGRQVAVGRSSALRTAFQEFKSEGFLIRLALRPEHSVSLRLLRDEPQPTSFLDPALERLAARERLAILAKNVQSTARGDRVINGIPTVQQGNTPYCGVHSLAMVAQYHGLRLEADDLAAGADFKNTGNARGSDILGLYKALGEELGLKLQVGTKFSRADVEKHISEGLPVIVWRRVTKERDVAHTANSEKITRDPSAILPYLKDEQRFYPPGRIRELPSHASVVSGYNREKGEVIFSEPWGAHARERRMRIEEMEASVYQVFTYRL
jgi:hypothetical protein